jgi:predicted transcriptional regulator
VKYSYVLPKNVIIPKGRRELLKSLGHSELLNKKAVEHMMVETVQVAVILNEKEAIVMFPTQKGETDLTMAFYSEDPIFHEWCLDYFRYRWYGSDIFDESKLKEI